MWVTSHRQRPSPGLSQTRTPTIPTPFPTAPLSIEAINCLGKNQPHHLSCEVTLSVSPSRSSKDLKRPSANSNNLQTNYNQATEEMPLFSSIIGGLPKKTPLNGEPKQPQQPTEHHSPNDVNPPTTTGLDAGILAGRWHYRASHYK